MKKIITVLMLMFVVAIAISAVAAEQSVKFNSPTIVSGTKLEPGDYIVKYDIKGNTADVKVIKGTKTVVTTTGKVVESKETIQQPGLVRSINADGSANLKEIQLPSKNKIITLDTDTAVGK